MSEVPPLSRSPGLNRPVSAVASLTDLVSQVFAPDGPLARAVPDFEPREGQLAMSAAVARAFDNASVLLAEAGTGTGKTLAYLIPAILSRQRVLVSTGTKNLQEQIFFKDIPLLREALGIPFSATCMKGRSNYLCLHRLDQLADQPGPAAHGVFLPIIQEWSGRTTTGDRAEIEDLPEDLAFWNDVSASVETCLGAECPRYDDCFVTRMRQQAAAADVVIVNHHLLCADAAVRHRAHGEVIPACSFAIIDEAHQLEDIATQYFGLSVSSYRLDDLARDLERHERSGAGLTATDGLALSRALERLRDDSRTFFADLGCVCRSGERGRSEERIHVTAETLSGVQASGAQLTGALDLVEKLFATAPASGTASDPEEDASVQDGRALARRASEIRKELRFLLRAADSGFVYYVEFRGRGVFFRASPIDVSGIVRDLLLDRVRATVLTSATLTVDESFAYVRTRLGVGAAEELRCPSEFDYTRQAILYLPQRMPDPRTPDFALAAGRQVVEILKRTRGRAFVLFTSYATLRAVQAIAEMALDYPLLVQGTAPRSQLLKLFRETPNSVLFATASFWQGVDVIGEALSCVIVDKLPFSSPADPVTAARIAAIREAGGEPFGEYQIPLAVLALQQGLGRLIRHRRDRGVLVVLDPRLRTKGYGRRFLASMPPTPIVHELDAIERFLSIV